MQNPSTNRSAAIVVAMSGLWAVGVYAAFFPGAMSVDSFVLLEQARGSTFSDAYPPMMSLIWRELLGLVDGPEAMLALLVSSFATGVALISISQLQRHGDAAIIIACLVFAWPPILGIIGVLWIDVLMASSLLLAVGLVASGELMPRPWQVLVWIGAAACLFVAVGARHNALAAALPLAIWAMLVALGPRLGRARIAVAALLGVVIAATAFTATATLTARVVTEKKHLWVTLAAYDTIGIGVRANDFEALNIFLPATPADLKVLYSPRSWLPLTFGEQIHAPTTPFSDATPIPIEQLRADAGSRRRLAAIWASSIVRHPGSYLEHRLAVFGSLVGLPPWTGLWGPVFTRIDENALGIPSRGNTWLATALSPFVGMGIFAPWFHLFVSAGVFATALIRAVRTKAPAAALAAALAASGLLHMAGLAATAMSADYRYSHWMIVTTVASAGLLAVSSRRAREKPGR